MGGVLIIHHFFLTHFAQHFQIGFSTTIPNNHSQQPFPCQLPKKFFATGQHLPHPFIYIHHDKQTIFSKTFQKISQQWLCSLLGLLFSRQIIQSQKRRRESISWNRLPNLKKQTITGTTFPACNDELEREMGEHLVTPNTRR